MATGPSPDPVGEIPVPPDSPATEREASSRALEDRYRSYLRLTRDAVARFGTACPVPIVRPVGEQVDGFIHHAVLDTAKHLARSTAVPADDARERARVIHRSARRAAHLARRLLRPRVPEEPMEPWKGVRPTRAIGTLLIAEDEPIVRLLMKRILEGAGYVVIVAESGEAAIELAHGFDGAIDGLVTDVIMSGMSGCELARRLRDERSGIRVLFVSGYSADALRQHGEFVELATFLAKPFSPETLLDRVAEALAASKW